VKQSATGATADGGGMAQAGLLALAGLAPATRCRRRTRRLARDCVWMSRPKCGQGAGTRSIRTWPQRDAASMSRPSTQASKCCTRTRRLRRRVRRIRDRPADVRDAATLPHGQASGRLPRSLPLRARATSGRRGLASGRDGGNARRMPAADRGCPGYWPRQSIPRRTMPNGALRRRTCRGHRAAHRDSALERQDRARHQRRQNPTQHRESP
jgi:hypothetical protein